MNHETTPHEKPFTIIVNAEEKEVATKELVFDQVVSLAFPNASKNDNRLYTVTYRRAAGEKPEGTLVESGTVKVKEGTIFNVTATDKS